MKYNILDLKNKDLAELFLEAGLVESKNEARRLMKQRGLKINENVISPGTRGLLPLVIPQEFEITLSRGKKRKKALTVETGTFYLVPV